MIIMFFLEFSKRAVPDALSLSKMRSRNQNKLKTWLYAPPVLGGIELAIRARETGGATTPPDRLILDSGTQAAQIALSLKARFDSRRIPIGIQAMRKLLQSTTSITLCMALVVPGMTPTLASAQTVSCAEEGEEKVFPCVLPDGTEIATEAEMQEMIADQNPAEAEEASEAPDAENAQSADTDAVENEAVENAEAAPAEAAPVAEAPAEEAAPAETSEQTAPTAEEQPAPPAEENAQAPAPAQAEQQSEADPSEQVDQEAAELEQALKEEQAAAETQEQSTEQTEPPVQESSEQAETPAPAAEQPDAETSAPAQSATPPEAQQTAEQPVNEAEQPVDEEARAARQAARQEARRAERQAQLEAAREALEQEPATETTTQEVTADETRRSDQDFETSATGSAETQNDDGDDGLSNLEKALLLGLGAAVVGTVLKNGDRVLSNSGDRVVVQDETGDLRVLKDDDALLRRPGDEVRTETFNDGSTRQIVEKQNGSRIITIRGSDGTVLRRISVDANGNETTLFDDLADEREVIVSELPQIRERSFSTDQRSEEDLRAALIAQQQADQNRSFSLRQVREIEQVRALAPPIELDAARFATGSAAIAPEQARSLARVGNTLRDMIAENPRTVFLIEGHTDAVGDASYNLALSDRRAETVALALTEYFDVPPENMITQGYGESALKVQTSGAEQANRRAVVRNITNLLRQASN